MRGEGMQESFHPEMWKKNGLFFPQNIEGFCLYWSRFTATVWSGAQSLEHTECSQIGWVLSVSCQHFHSFTGVLWGEDPTVFQRSEKGLVIPSLSGWCGGTATLTGGTSTQCPLGSSLNHGLRLRREQCLWAALQRDAMHGCTSLNVRIQCIQAGDFTTNSERQQSTEGVQAWSWAVAWSISEITNRWRECFCFQGVFFFLFCSVFTCCIDQQICSAFFLCSHSSLQTLPDYLQIFVNTLQGKICQMKTALQLKPCKSQQVLFTGMCACVAFWVSFAWIRASWATGSDKTSKPTPNSPFYSGFTVKPPQTLGSSIWK